jgi:hypothetical protein
VNQRLGIGGAGTVLTSNGSDPFWSGPARCSADFRAYGSSGWHQWIGSGAWETVILDTEAFDTDGVYNLATGVFTAPATGRYFLHAKLVGASALDPTHPYLLRLYNATTATQLESVFYSQQNNSFNAAILEISAVLNIGNDNSVQLQMYQGSGVPYGIGGMGPPMFATVVSSFEGFRVR